MAMMTDRLHFVVIIALVLVGASAIYGNAIFDIDAGQLHAVGRFRTEGLIAGVVLNLSTLLVVLLDPSSWSRVM